MSDWSQWRRQVDPAESLSGDITVDQGNVQRRNGLRISDLAQQLPIADDTTVLDSVRQGLADQFKLIEQYTILSSEGASDTASLQKLEHLQSQIDALGGWQPEQQAQCIITQLALPSSARMADLSGGWRRRVALARALVSKADLCTDEPTNHLDIATIEWLEHELRGYSGSVISLPTIARSCKSWPPHCRDRSRPGDRWPTLRKIPKTKRTSVGRRGNTQCPVRQTPSRRRDLDTPGH